MRCLSRPFLNTIYTTVKRACIPQGWRCLYTEQALDLTDYKKCRQLLKNTPGLDLDIFRQTLKISLSHEKNSVAGADLRKMLHIVEKNEDDLTLLQVMVERCDNQPHDNRTYHLGPIIMRAFHYLNDPHAALDTVRNPKLQNLFREPKTFAILVDLLYENKMYKEVRDIYDSLRHKSVSKLVTTVVIMACYKQNTQESLQYALKLWESWNERNKPLRRMIVTLAALALRQNEWQLALKILQTCHNIDVMPVRTAQVMALCELGDLEHVQLKFHYALSYNGHYLADVAEKFDALVKRLNISPTSRIYRQFESLKHRRCIQPQTLDEYISTPIDVSKRHKHTTHVENRELERRKFQR